MDSDYQNSTVEALVLASPEPIPARKISQVMEEMTPTKVARAVAKVNERYALSGVSFRIRELAGGYQFYILPEYAGFVEELFARRRKLRLTRAALETAAIVAYRQPVTKAEIEHIRGVASDGVLHNLMEKKMVEIVGRASTVGKPLQYGTGDEFLKFFGLSTIKDLPKMAEIEELVAASEPKEQTELTLIREGEEEMVKLNVADGTFDPSAREEKDGEDELIAIDATIDQNLTASETALNEEIEAESDPDSDPVEKTGDDLSGPEDSETETVHQNRLLPKAPVPPGTHEPVGLSVEDKTE